jgi:Uma2 family endonuclease
MKLERGREPDLLFVAHKHLERLQETYLDGPADLAVEIVSPESAGRDRGERFYEAGGVAEYWLIDPQKERAEFYPLRAGQYRQVPPDTEGIYRSAELPGFRLRVEWLWQNPLPKALDVLRALGVL